MAGARLALCIGPVLDSAHHELRYSNTRPTVCAAAAPLGATISR